MKLLLSHIVKDYQLLKMHFFDILRQDHINQQQQQQQDGEEATKATTGTADLSPNNNIEDINNEEYNKLVSLSLGFSSKSSININRNINEDEKNLGEGLALGLNIIRFNPSKAEVEATNMASMVEGSSAEEAAQTDQISAICPPSKVLKTMTSCEDITIDASQQALLKKPRVSISARCDTQTMNDGCQWRKYGQKMAKGSPCPRAYYRCTVSPSCPVRKQVQRCAEDTSVLITTYQGSHDHPLPISATPWASTTSLAASMLQSPSFFSHYPSSSSSSSHLRVPIFTSSSIPPNYSTALNFSDSSRPPHLPQQFCFTSSSISTSTSHPTITFDFTSPPQPSSSSSHHFRNLISAFSPTPNISSSSTSLSSSSTSLYNAANYSNDFMNIGSHSGGTQPFLHQQQQHKALPEKTIPAATKAITTNPKFQSAIAAALTSYGNNSNNNNGVVGVGAGLNLKLHGGSSYSSGSSLRCMNKYGVSSSNGVDNARQGNLILFPVPPTLSMASPVLPVASWSPSVSSDRSSQILEQWKTKNLTITSKESNLQ